MEDTIAAISTPIGEGSIAVIRISGPQAFDVADRLFASKRGRPSQFPSHTIHFGAISLDGDILDRVMLSVMRSPRTYTGQDTVEINCHGGTLAAKRVLGAALCRGARLAQPGEFTKRAFLNGKMDLTQAEAVMDVIRATTDRSLASANRVLEGEIGERIRELRDTILSTLAHLEAHIDFPDDDIPEQTRDDLASSLAQVRAGLQELLATATAGKILRDGISVVIGGRPNVGKSTLMNALLGYDRSIVTPIAGTTRDTVEESANICGIPVRLTDTAGIRRSRGTVEQIGVARAHKALADSDITLYLLDASRPVNEADAAILNLCDGNKTIVVINKIDLPRRLILPANLPGLDCVETSAITRTGIEELKRRVEVMAMRGHGETTEGIATINERHAHAIRRAINYLTESGNALKERQPPEIVSQGIRSALSAVGEITGEVTTEDILQRIFSNFCIGK